MISGWIQRTCQKQLSSGQNMFSRVLRVPKARVKTYDVIQKSWRTWWNSANYTLKPDCSAWYKEIKFQLKRMARFFFLRNLVSNCHDYGQCYSQKRKGERNNERCAYEVRTRHLKITTEIGSLSRPRSWFYTSKAKRVGTKNIFALEKHL